MRGCFLQERLFFGILSFDYFFSQVVKLTRSGIEIRTDQNAPRLLTTPSSGSLPKFEKNRQCCRIRAYFFDFPNEFSFISSFLPHLFVKIRFLRIKFLNENPIFSAS